MTDQPSKVSGLITQLAAHPNSLVRLILLEASRFGMPPSLIAMLDELGAMLGFHPSLPSNQLGYLAGPLSVWRTDPRMPTMERTPELEALAMKQRADVIYGQAEPATAMIGPAEIVVAMGNLIDGTMPDAYRDLFDWAASRTMSELDGMKPEQWCADHKWQFIANDEVLTPAGRLYGTYVEVAQNIRRTATSGVKLDRHPRLLTTRLGEALLKHIADQANQADAAGDTTHAEALRAYGEDVRRYLDQAVLPLTKAEQPQSP